jgi:hypothetical protein
MTSFSSGLLGLEMMAAVGIRIGIRSDESRV